jgi:hypothetical protein
MIVSHHFVNAGENDFQVIAAAIMKGLYSNFFWGR